METKNTKTVEEVQAKCWKVVQQGNKPRKYVKATFQSDDVNALRETLQEFYGGDLQFAPNGEATLLFHSSINQGTQPCGGIARIQVAENMALHTRIEGATQVFEQGREPQRQAA